MYHNTPPRGGLSPHEYLTEAQMTVLRDYVRGLAEKRKSKRAWTDHVLIEVMLLSGLRASEVCALTLADLPCRHGKPAIEVRHGKGNIRRTVDISTRLVETLAAYVGRYRADAGDDDPLFTDCYGKALAYRTLYGKIRRHGERCGLKLHPHMTRSSFATRFYHIKQDIVGLKQQLGHKSIQTTLIYTATDPQDLREQVEKMC